MSVVLSIITVNLNNKSGLINTVKSVVRQTFEDFEWLIIDGGSDDGSKEVIQSVSDGRLRYWTSEPDDGIYNAMNKGIVRARGEYLLFLNSGDYLLDESVLSVVFGHSHSADIVYGDLVKVKNGVKYIEEGPNPDSLNASYFFHKSLPHQASFIKRQLFGKYGLYEEKNRIVSDWGFFLKCIVFEKVVIEHMNVPISIFCGGGISETCGERYSCEGESVLKNLFPPRILADYQENILSVIEIRRFVVFRLLYSLLYRLANMYALCYDACIHKKLLIRK